MAGTPTKKTRQRSERRTPLATPGAAKPASGRTTTRETPLTIRTRGITVDEATAAYMRKRAGFKLGKFALHITGVTARLTNISGPKGSPTLACKLVVTLASDTGVVLELQDSDLRAAFDVALDGIERAVRRLVERRQSTHARRPARSARA